MSGASRNWRRFNFFERHNTSLPKNVQLDILPEDRVAAREVDVSLGFVSVAAAPAATGAGAKKDESSSFMDGNSSINSNDYNLLGVVQALVFASSNVTPRVHCLNTAKSVDGGGGDGGVSVASGSKEEQVYRGFYEPFASEFASPNDNNATAIMDVAVVNYKNKYVCVASVSSVGSMLVSVFRSSTFTTMRESVVSAAIPISPLFKVKADGGTEKFTTVDIILDSGICYVAAGCQSGKVGNIKNRVKGFSGILNLCNFVNVEFLIGSFVQFLLGVDDSRISLNRTL